MNALKKIIVVFRVVVIKTHYFISDIFLMKK